MGEGVIFPPLSLHVWGGERDLGVVVGSVLSHRERRPEALVDFLFLLEGRKEGERGARRG